jgi:hypothetical protein
MVTVGRILPPSSRTCLAAQQCTGLHNLLHPVLLRSDARPASRRVTCKADPRHLPLRTGQHTREKGSMGSATDSNIQGTCRASYLLVWRPRRLTGQVTVLSV